MSNDTTLLLGLAGLVAQRVEVDDSGAAVVHLSTSDVDAARCPSCAQLSSRPKQQVTTRPRDLPHGGRGVRLLWHKRRWLCANAECGKRSFTESVPQVPSRARLTSRLRAQAGAAVCDRGATVSQAARDHGLSWPTVMDAVSAHAMAVLPDETDPVQVLGIDETRRGRPRFHVNPDTREWEMVVDRWHVSFVDIGAGQGLLGQAEGRTKSTVVDWLQARGQARCEQVRYVAIDMCSVFAAGIALALPNATLVVDHFHVVQLANQAIDEVRCRITTQLRGRRGRKGDGEWDVRNLLTRNREDLSDRRFARMWNTLIDLGTPGEDILAAYIAKENLRELLALARAGETDHLPAARRLTSAQAAPHHSIVAVTGVRRWGSRGHDREGGRHGPDSNSDRRRVGYRAGTGQRAGRPGRHRGGGRHRRRWRRACRR